MISRPPRWNVKYAEYAGSAAFLQQADAATVLAANGPKAGKLCVAINLTKLDRVADRARRRGEQIAPQLRALEAALAENPELRDETPPSILLHCAVAFLIAAEGRAAALHRLAHMVEAVGADFIEPRIYENLK